MNWSERIVTDPGTCGGRPRVKGKYADQRRVLAGAQGSRLEARSRYLRTIRTLREDPQAVFAYAQSIPEDESFVPVARAG